MATPPAEWKLPDLRVDADGDWYDGGVQVTHAGILANLRGSLRKDAQGYFIQTRVRVPVRVDDAPFVITRIERRGDALYGALNDGSQETIDPATLRLGASDVPYATVKGGTFDARLSRAAAFQLWALLEHDDPARGARLRVGEREYDLGRRTGR